MNETGSTIPAMPTSAGVFTTAHLTLIVVLAIVVVLAIWWGGRMRRQHPGEQSNDASTPLERGAEAPPVKPPVTPSPPPLVDSTSAVLIEPTRADAEAIATPDRDVAAAPHMTGDGAQSVTVLKGLGPKVAARLAALGITNVGQIAALTPAAADDLDAELGTFRGRMARDRWIEQARLLAAGDRAGYEATFGKLG